MISRFPFVWTAPVGHFLARTLQTVVYLIATKAAVATFLVFYTFCQMLIAFTVDLTVTISEFNFFIKTEIEPFSAQSRREMAQKLCTIMQFHGDNKR